MIVLDTIKYFSVEIRCMPWTEQDDSEPYPQVNWDLDLLTLLLLLHQMSSGTATTLPRFDMSSIVREWWRISYSWRISCSAGCRCSQQSPAQNLPVNPIIFRLEASHGLHLMQARKSCCFYYLCIMHLGYHRNLHPPDSFNSFVVKSFWRNCAISLVFGVSMLKLTPIVWLKVVGKTRI